MLAAWLATTAWGFWLIQGRAAFARAQAASDPIRVEALQVWGARLGAGSHAAPLLVLLPSDCGCSLPAELLQRLKSAAASRSIRVESPPMSSASELRALLPQNADLLLFNPSGLLLFAGPAESRLHCSEGSSLAELVLSQAQAQHPPLWAPILDDPFLDEACDCGAADSPHPTL